METQEKSRQKMQKGRLYWTVSGERRERPMKGDWSEGGAEPQELGLCFRLFGLEKKTLLVSGFAVYARWI